MRIFLCGNFANDNFNVVNGQVTKTRNLFHILSCIEKNTIRIDSANMRRRPLTFLLRFWKEYNKCDVLCLCVARNGTKILLPLIHFFGRFKKKRKLFFVIGTCPLPKDYRPGQEIPKKIKKLAKYLSTYNYVLSETEALRDELSNVFQLNNVSVFKNYQVGKEPIINNKKTFSLPIKLVFFSRIGFEKNIGAYASIPNEIKKKITIDFFGPIENATKDEFENLIKNNPNYKYCGVIKSDECIPVLANYDALIFTTNRLEGTPGAIIDAYFAGLPVISQPFWASNELICDNCLGVVRPFIGDAINEYLINDSLKEEIDSRVNCFAQTYTLSSATKRIRELIEE